MARQNINNTPADSGLGDSLKLAFDKVNAMTLELYAADSSFADEIDLINVTIAKINDGSLLNHTHTIAQIQGLQSTLNSKISASTYIGDMMAINASIQAINDALNDIVVILNTKVEEAPFSGVTYGRNNGEWVEITGGTITGDYVPYTGATKNVDLGANGLTATTISATTYLNIPNTAFTGGTVTGGTRFTNGLTANTISASTYNLNTINNFSLVGNGNITISGGTSVTRRNENNSTNDAINYCGIALGTNVLDSAAAWTITRITVAVDGSVTTAISAVNSIWNNRESISYT